MAKVTVKLPEDFLLKVSKLGGQTDRIIESCLEAGSEVVLSKVRSNLNSVIAAAQSTLPKLPANWRRL